jgi:GDP/UDP-N,N'-diacetylbacillosamine 2-epimerase (hydrolysing)
VRRIVYVSGTRADFGLMRRTLLAIREHERLQLGLCVTGMHLLPSYGETVREIEASGFDVVERIRVELDGTSGAMMARALAVQMDGMAKFFERSAPDLVLVLGDRGEMLAAAIAALHLNIPVAHIHGGELSGTVDEPVRHAISKLAHYHFASTVGARERLIRMGENPLHVFVTGAPGLDGLGDGILADRHGLCRKYGLNPDEPIALVVFHPVVQDALDAGVQVRALLDALHDQGVQRLCLMPNSDAGGAAVRTELLAVAGAPGTSVLTHLPRDEYLVCLAAVDVLAGNSSSGIIEAASFGLPVVNVGDRQQGRERSGNVIDVPVSRESIGQAVARAVATGRMSCGNVYGDGLAAGRIVEHLAGLPLDAGLLHKRNAY